MDDFLVITALKEETEALERHLNNVTWIEGTRFSRGTVPCEEGKNMYTVVYGQCDESGTNPASQLTDQGIMDYKPRYVLLIGIAAGFPERGVCLGDVLVPEYIVLYEKAKLTPQGIEYRGKRVQISAVHLFDIAKKIAHHQEESWYLDIQQPRPNNDQRSFPVIWPEGALGSGDKIVADEKAYVREYLTKNHVDSMGLEMEAAGCWLSCYKRQTLFLVVKGVQDDATVNKDAEGKKDVWRLYAADAAATLAVKIMGYVPYVERGQPTATLITDSVEDYESKVWAVLEEYESNRPVPSFEYTVSLADTYRDLRAKRFTLPNQPPDKIMPSEAQKATILHGGGGTGKTQIMHVLARQLLEQGRLPVLIDLKLWSARGTAEQAEAKEVEDILRQCATPRFQSDFLKQLSQGQRDFVVMVDGLNEVPSRVRDELLRYFRGILTESTRSFLLVADRYGTSDYPDGFAHAGLDELAEDFVQQIFDDQFAPETTFEGLERSVKDILKIPFFLDLKINQMAQLGLPDTKSAMLEEFLLKQLGIGENDLNKIAEETTAICAEYQSQTFDATEFESKVGKRLYQLLCEASVLSRGGNSFEHHLWRDYLCARYLAKNQNAWEQEDSFDAATFTAESLEPLAMVVEQLEDTEATDKFLRQVYDWNFYAAIDCVREAIRSPRAPVSDSIRFALLAAITEKRFDRVIRTVERAAARLQEHQYSEALPFCQVSSLSELIDHIRGLEGESPWFSRWKDLFVSGEERVITEEDINLLTDANSILGWTAANVARRSKLNEAGQQQVRTIYVASTGRPRAGSIRWRAVHVLGAYPSRKNVSLLASALQKDSYHWVQYGAARALVEIAASAGSRLRKDALGHLGDAIEQVWSKDSRSGRLISREVRKTVFIRGAGSMWKENVRSLLHRLRDLEPEASEREDWTQQIDRFDAEELP